MSTTLFDTYEGYVCVGKLSEDATRYNVTLPGPVGVVMNDPFCNDPESEARFITLDINDYDYMGCYTIQRKHIVPINITEDDCKRYMEQANDLDENLPCVYNTTSTTMKNFVLNFLETYIGFLHGVERPEVGKGAPNVCPSINQALSEDEMNDLYREMISNVDINNFRKAYSSLKSHNEGQHKFMTKEEANSVLLKWAKAKWKFYMMFGRKLILSKESTYIADDSDYCERFKTLEKKFPNHVLSLRAFIQICHCGSNIHAEYANIAYNNLLETLCFNPTGNLYLTLANTCGNEVANEYDALITSWDGVCTLKTCISIDPVDIIRYYVESYQFNGTNRFIEVLEDDSLAITYVKTEDGMKDFTVCNYCYKANSFSAQGTLIVDFATMSALHGCSLIKVKNIDTSFVVRQLYETVASAYTNSTNRWRISRRKKSEDYLHFYDLYSSVLMNPVEIRHEYYNSANENTHIQSNTANHAA